MRAAVLHQTETSVVLEDVQVDAPAFGEVWIETAATGICHSDRHGQVGGIAGLPLPTVLGHEAAGVVVEVGAGVDAVQPGDHVVVAPAGSCGTCRRCSAGLPQHCTRQRRVREDGTARLRQHETSVNPFVGIGSFAEQMLVPASCVAPVPAELPLDKAALLGCAVITGLGAVRHTARIELGQTVAVIGCGGVGLSVVQGAVLAGATRVVAVDRVPEKLALAQHLGATDVVDAGTVDPVQAVLDLTGGVDHVIEVVGLPTTIEQGYAMLDVAGALTVVGLPHAGATVTLPAGQFLFEKRIQGSRLGAARLRVDVPLYADMYLRGALDLDTLQGATIGMDDLPAALEGIDAALAARTVVTF